MKRLWADQALLPTGWAKDVRVDYDTVGRISRVEPGSPPMGHKVGVLLPAPVNVHSHAFQRAMAGLTEQRGPNPRDSFWTWRQLMFRFLDRLTPDHVEAIAAFVQLEMLEAGYATNTEFHYLHHRPGGAPYDNISEMSQRVIAAAAETGIGLCLLPVHYQFGGCDGRDLEPGQIRFGNDMARFETLCDEAQKSLNSLSEDAAFGVAPHSLRAVGVDDLINYGNRFPAGPIHMHLAEQISEVQEVKAVFGARPVEWALEHMGLDDRWCLIHCTQMNARETTQLAKSGGVAGLCPITESSLGDGIFDAVHWTNAGGAFAIGSDSNIRISLSEELRSLDYSQRLRDGTRSALASSKQSTGRRMFEHILRGGALATGRRTGALATGYWADLLCLDMNAVQLWERCGDTLLDSWIFAGDDNLVTDVWSAGRHIVRESAHVQKDEITAAYLRTISELKDAL